jgi:hypothetical protein
LLGVCRNPVSCKPNGDVCKLKTMSCNASCDCCSGNCETQDTCRPDNVGVPRCTGASCVAAGQACSTSADCCGGLPCVPNPSGGSPPFVCYAGGACVPNCGGCSINADCCAGEVCNIAQGSTRGYCAPCNPPSDAGAPPDSGTAPDAGTAPDSGGPPPDAAPPDASTTPDAGDASTCALYGQLCTVNADCCNNVPCTAGRCTSP